MQISVVIPLLNEADNLAALNEQLLDAINTLNSSYEIIYVDDGSDDNSFAILSDLAAQDSHVKVVRLRRNFGQTAAISAGFHHARGDVVVTLDADLQNDPADIPRLVAKLEEGFDVVSGWRRVRKDVFITRWLPSKIASALISRVTGLRLHDYGCTLKAYRREALEDLHLYGEMHRIIPAYVGWAGFSVVELEVQYHPRLRGRSKSGGLSRTPRVILDVLTAKFLNDFATHPVHIFGGLGLLCMTAGVGAGVIVLLQRFLSDLLAHRNPILILAVFLFLLGMQFIVLGLLAELLTRTYYESQKKQIYTVSARVNIEEPVEM